MNSNSRYTGRCVNVPACALATQGQDLTFEPGQPAVCPACGNPAEILGVAWNQNSTTEQRQQPNPATLPPSPVPGGYVSPVPKKTSPGVWIAIAAGVVLVFGLIGYGLFRAALAIAMDPSTQSSPGPSDSSIASAAPAATDAVPAATDAGSTDAGSSDAGAAGAGTPTHELHIKNESSDQVLELRFAGPGTGFDANNLLNPVAPGATGSGYKPDSEPCTVDIMATIGVRPVYKDGVDICASSQITISNPTSDEPTEWHFRKNVLETGTPEAYAPE